LIRLIYTAFGVCSIWHLAAVSLVKCSVIVRPLTHFTIFTDRVLRAIICTIWTLDLIIGIAINFGVTDAYFSWISMVAFAKRQNTSFANAFGALNIVVSTLIIMTAYTKVFLVVRRQVRSISTAVLEPVGPAMIFGSSVRSAKNLFVMCAAYYLTYLPVMVRLVLRTRGLKLHDAVEFAIIWIYLSSAALNGLLYIALHSSVKRELRRYLPRCRRPMVAPARTQPVGDGGAQRHLDSADTGTGAPDVSGAVAPTSSGQHLAKRLPNVAV